MFIGVYCKKKYQTKSLAMRNEYLLQKKGIPDLFYLFKRNILSVDDVIKIRDSGQASIFRKWLKSNDFDTIKNIENVSRKFFTYQ